MSAESVALFAEASVMEETIVKFTNLSEEEFAYAKEEFDSIDKDGSGTLDNTLTDPWDILNVWRDPSGSTKTTSTLCRVSHHSFTSH